MRLLMRQAVRKALKPELQSMICLLRWKQGMWRRRAMPPAPMIPIRSLLMVLSCSCDSGCLCSGCRRPRRAQSTMICENRARCAMGAQILRREAVPAASAAGFALCSSR